MSQNVSKMVIILRDLACQAPFEWSEMWTFHGLDSPQLRFTESHRDRVIQIPTQVLRFPLIQFCHATVWLRFQFGFQCRIQIIHLLHSSKQVCLNILDTLNQQNKFRTVITLKPFRSTIHVKSGSRETVTGSLIIPLDSAVFMVILEAPLFLRKHNFYLSTKPRYLTYPKRFWLIGSVQTKQEICAHLWVGLDRPYDCYKCSKLRVPILKMFRGI